MHDLELVMPSAACLGMSESKHHKEKSCHNNHDTEVDTINIAIPTAIQCVYCDEEQIPQSGRCRTATMYAAIFMDMGQDQVSKPCRRPLCDLVKGHEQQIDCLRESYQDKRAEICSHRSPNLAGVQAVDTSEIDDQIKEPAKVEDEDQRKDLVVWRTR